MGTIGYWLVAVFACLFFMIAVSVGFALFFKTTNTNAIDRTFIIILSIVLAIMWPLSIVVVLMVILLSFIARLFDPVVIKLVSRLKKKGDKYD